MNKEVEKILLEVQKPARYVGGELNSITKDKQNIDVRFAFCFPDTYEVGMSHLGSKIIYSLINSKENYWCERVYAPWIDMEDKMKENNITLYALESGDSLNEFDFVAFTLQYELTYTNILNMLSMSNIPLLSKDREGLKNIILGGGPCACNPEPIADFFDIFCLGDGEEILLEVLEVYEACKRENTSREEFLIRVAKVEGVYVPSLYEVEYNDDNTVKSVTAKGDTVASVKKRACMDLDSMFAPDTFVVPFIDIIHDRTTVEVLRGCVRGCRFCQAGYLYRPFRERSVQAINQQCKAICDSTGYDEISLSSLSTSDYTDLFNLLDTMHEWTEEEKVSVSLPSLRVDNFSEDLIKRIASVRKSSLTFAPEAGSQRMRDVINKNVSEEQLLKTVNIAFSNGWSRVKLYFMLGLPTETMEDILEITKLGQTVVDEYYRNPDKKKGVGVSVSISAAAFVPKPFTPFQWFGQDPVDVMKKKQYELKSSVTTRKLSVNYHGADTGFIEAVFARGDRKLSKVLLEAHARGFKFDGWSECFSYKNWLQIFEDLNIDPAFYANRHRSFDEVLPWDHLDYGVSKEFLIRECKKAYEATTTEDCKNKCSACGASCFKGGICP